MVVLSRTRSYLEIDEEYESKDIPVSEKVIDLIKDLLEDNPDIELSYKGIKIKSVDGELYLNGDGEDGFVIYTELTEPDIDNIKIHGFSYNIIEGECIIDEPSDIEIVINTNFNKTNLFL